MMDALAVALGPPAAKCGMLPARPCAQQRARVRCSGLFDEHRGNGAAPQGPQSASIQHPIFPEPQAPVAGPVPVQTQRGIPMFKTVIPDRPCPRCGGTGRETCGDCRGKGRLNYRGVAMLPQGVWPQWCPSCRASGRWCCAQCMGTGVKRGVIGFRMPDEEEGS